MPGQFLLMEVRSFALDKLEMDWLNPFSLYNLVCSKAKSKQCFSNTSGSGKNNEFFFLSLFIC